MHVFYFFLFIQFKYITIVEQDQSQRPVQRDRGIWGNYVQDTGHTVQYHPADMRKYGNRGKKPFRGGGRGGYYKGK